MVNLCTPTCSLHPLKRQFGSLVLYQAPPSYSEGELGPPVSDWFETSTVALISNLCMKKTDYLCAVAGGFAARFGVVLSRGAKHAESLEALALLRPTIAMPLLKIGGDGDGSYLIPDDLEGVTHCFSPGVGPSSSFEFDLAERGIEVFMADASVSGPAMSHERFHFTPAYLGSFSDPSRRLISMDDWVQSECGNEPSGDMILQMDIEGGEYQVIHSMSEALLRRFRIVVIEFHHLYHLRHAIICRYMRSAFEKLQKHFRICYVQENRAEGDFSVGGKRHSRLLEVTFLRKDRV